MKDHLETAPVIDAVKQDSCPFCRLRDMIEQQTVERYLGGAVMEPDIRIRTNATGFCRQHHRLLMAQKDYHGYALMMQTRLKTVAAQLAPAVKSLAGASLFGTKNAAALQRQAADATRECLVCRNMEDTVSRYMDIFMKLYREDERFRADFGRSIGSEIKRQRLAKVKLLLRNSGVPVAEIARQTGFCSASHLASAFRIATGVTPRTWRNSIP